MLYSKRRKNLGGGRRKRSNRRFYSSKRVYMIGGENGLKHYTVEEYNDIRKYVTRKAFFKKNRQ